MLVNADYSVVVVTRDGQRHFWGSLLTRSLARYAVESGKWMEAQAA